MNSTEKEIIYKISNSYSTLNALTSKTRNVIFACHGMGYLSRYFLKYFKGLDSELNYIIVPQAQSKYYIAPKMKHVGALCGQRRIKPKLDIANSDNDDN